MQTVDSLREFYNGKAYIDLSKKGSTRRSRREGENITLRALAAELNDQAQRMVDVLVPYSKITFTTGVIACDKGITKRCILLSITDSDNMHLGTFPVADRVIAHLVRHCSEDNGTKTTIGKHYLDVLLDDNSDNEDVKMAATNLTHWMNKRSGESHYSRGKDQKRLGDKRVFVRLLNARKDFEPGTSISDVPTGYIVTALMSDSYLSIPSAEMLATALQVVSGDFYMHEDVAARPDHDGHEGAKLTDYFVDPYKVRLTLLNPKMAFNLNDPDAGVIHARQIEDLGGGSTKYTYADGVSYTVNPNGTTHGEGMGKEQPYNMIFPKVSIENDEGGGGSARASSGFMEQWCNNGCTAEYEAMKKSHSSSKQLEGKDSSKTHEARKKLIMCEMADAIAAAFDPEKFLELAVGFYNLQSIKVKDKKDTLEFVAKAVGMEGILDDLLGKYEQMTQGQDTLMDVQRALTDVAQDQLPENADRMERFAGSLVTGDTKISKELIAS